jgi:hypothetical protein
MTKTTAPVDRLTREAAPFFKLLTTTALKRGDSYEAMLETLGLTAGRANQLSNGLQLVDDLTVAFARKCAAYTGLSLDALLATPDA